MGADFQSLWSGAKLVLPSIIGSGIGATFISILFKRKFDRELEIQKAALHRGSKIHEQQVEILGRLYKYLSTVQELTQSLSSSASMQSAMPEYEKEHREYYSQLGSAFREAKSEFLLARLYLPEMLSNQIEEFFTEASECAGILYYSTSDAPFRQSTNPERLSIAYRTAIVKLPALLKSIESLARKIIHGNKNG
jgi:hypothetical protein